MQGFSINDECAQVLVYRIISVDLVIGFAYLPKGSCPEGVETLWNLMGLLHRLYTNIIVMGDLNTRMNLCGDGYNPAGRFLEDALKNSSYFERLSANEPTYRNQSVLDHTIISKNLSGIVQQHRSVASSLAGLSDHVPTIIQLEMPEVQEL